MRRGRGVVYRGRVSTPVFLFFFIFFYIIIIIDGAADHKYVRNAYSGMNRP